MEIKEEIKKEIKEEIKEETKSSDEKKKSNRGPKVKFPEWVCSYFNT